MADDGKTDWDGDVRVNVSSSPRVIHFLPCRLAMRRGSRFAFKKRNPALEIEMGNVEDTCKRDGNPVTLSCLSVFLSNNNTRLHHRTHQFFFLNRLFTYPKGWNQSSPFYYDRGKARKLLGNSGKDILHGFISAFHSIDEPINLTILQWSETKSNGIECYGGKYIELKHGGTETGTHND